MRIGEKLIKIDCLRRRSLWAAHILSNSRHTRNTSDGLLRISSSCSIINELRLARLQIDQGQKGQSFKLLLLKSA